VLGDVRRSSAGLAFDWLAHTTAAA